MNIKMIKITERRKSKQIPLQPSEIHTTQTALKQHLHLHHATAETASTKGYLL